LILSELGACVRQHIDRDIHLQLNSFDPLQNRANHIRYLMYTHAQHKFVLYIQFTYKHYVVISMYM